MSCDAVVIGAGLAGLAAGIRLAYFGKKVVIVESHSVGGGLNSWYRRGARVIDVGLHAMTNFAPEGARGAPLTKLLRQLRLRHADLDLVEQNFSAIAFPGARLEFTNDFADFARAVAARFPDDASGFADLTAAVNACDDTALDAAPKSARAELERYLRSPLLREMLLCPLMYYGNAAENDMDWTQFATMWKAVFVGGFCRPRGGMRPLIERLQEAFAANGGEIRWKARVKEILVEGGAARGVRLENGEEISAAQVFSSAGRAETAALCPAPPAAADPALAAPARPGRLGFAELVLYLPAPPAGESAAIVFFCDAPQFRFAEPEGLVDASSGVICCPNNFRYPGGLPEGCLRVTARANYDRWAALSPTEYAAAKKEAAAQMLAAAERFYPGAGAAAAFQDLFTPLTVARFTGHARGAIYGTPDKRRDGRTPYANLFLIGTDQGFLGIVGSLLSGITIANAYGLRP